MSDYYNGKRTRNIYQPGSSEPFKLSRSKIDLFLNCSRCFFLDRRLGVGQPPSFPFNLNTAVDTLLKKEFDTHRDGCSTHPLMKAYGLDLVPFRHEKMDEWRENFKGVQFLHKKTNLMITGAVDDLWTDKDGLVYVVDYKSTSKTSEVNLDADWQIGYKRQMEVYQWLLRQNGFKVSDTGYFVYCNGQTDREAFDAKLEFDIKIIPYTGDDSWVDEAVIKAHECLNGNTVPKASDKCDYCNYVKTIEKEIDKFSEGKPTYEEVKAAVLEAGKVSTAFLQRKFRIRYVNAAKFMDQLETEGIIEAYAGKLIRKIKK